MRGPRTGKWVAAAAAWALLSPLAAPESAAQSWLRGAMVVEHVEGEVSLRQVGEGEVARGSLRTPFYVSTLLQVRSAEGGETLARMSNGFVWLHRGSGYLGVERFEQAVERDPAAGKGAGDGGVPELAGTGETRMILNFRRGLLVLDARSRREASQILVETPVGGVSVGAGVLIIRIDVNRRRRIYDFAIACVDGTVRFRDRRGAEYTVRAGQRLSGAGSAGSPAIEVASVSENDREMVARMEQLLEAHPMDTAKRNRLAAAMRPLGREYRRDAGPRGGEAEPGDGRRPIVLEYVPRPPPVVPYQGDVRPPSDREADLF